MRSVGHRRLVLPAVLLVSLVAFVAAMGAAASPPSQSNSSGARQQLKGTKPAWTAAASQTGTVSNSQQESATVWLAPRNSAQLAQLTQAVSSPSSPQYRQFLSHDQYVAQFAPTSAQVSAVTNWLQQSKLKVASVGPDNHYVAVAGSAAAMATAFGAQLGLYAVNGSDVQAPTSDLSVPSSVAGSVLGGHGPQHLRSPGAPRPQPGERVRQRPALLVVLRREEGARPAEVPEQAAAVLAVRVHPAAVPGHLRRRRVGAGRVSGVTVAIVDAFDSPTLLSDADTYSPRHGDQAFAPGQFSDNSVPENTSLAAPCGGSSWYGEQTLDVEAVHGMAQGANVAYYGAASCFDADLLAALTQVVSDDKASIVSDSWGQPTFVVVNNQLFITIDDSIVLPYESVFLHGAVEEMGFSFSSGDNGDEQAATGFPHPDWPAEDPLVTAVGGTSLAVGNANNRLFETGWGVSQWGLSNDGSSWVQTLPFKYGAGGGYSQLAQSGLVQAFFPGGSFLSQGEPFYQDGVVPENDSVCPTGPGANQNGCRGVPDIAMDGDPTTGMLIGQTQRFTLPTVFGPAGDHYGEYRVGGTSLASPLFAGAEAVAQQGLGMRIGFVNPLIYGLKSTSNGASSFYDSKATQPDPGNVRADYVNSQNADGGTSFSVRTFDQDSSLNVAKGWDDVTGVGTVTGRYIAQVAGS